MVQDYTTVNTGFGASPQTRFMDQGINNLPNPESQVANSLPNNPLYNALQVIFRGKQTDNIAGYNPSELFSSKTNGLKANLPEILPVKPDFMAIG